MPALSLSSNVHFFHFVNVNVSIKRAREHETWCKKSRCMKPVSSRLAIFPKIFHVSFAEIPLRLNGFDELKPNIFFPYLKSPL